MSDHVFDEKAWDELDIFNQMGNIGSEVGRAMSAMRQNNKKRMFSAFYRGIDLLNATIRSRVAKGESAREIFIAREEFANAILNNQDDRALEKYFMEFAIAARLNR